MIKSRFLSIPFDNFSRSPVTYVTGDVAGAMESPVYAILKLGPEMDKFQAPGGYAIEQHMAALPTDAEHYSMKWMANDTSLTKCSAILGLPSRWC